jgi:hypothetical protein
MAAHRLSPPKQPSSQRVTPLKTGINPTQMRLDTGSLLNPALRETAGIPLASITISCFHPLRWRKIDEIPAA